MAINGIKSLRYGVEDVILCTRFFTDFGLALMRSGVEQASFSLPDGSRVELARLDASSLPKGALTGCGVRQVVWGVDTREALDMLVAGLSVDHDIAEVDGEFWFTPFFGVPMALALWQPRRVVSAPDPLNAPGYVNRLNTHRKWRRVARPRLINHVVFQTPDYGAAADFMRARLGFRLSDIQEGFGTYLRADGTNNHHSVLLLNAHAHLPGCDGQVRFDHANFGLEDIDELMVGVNAMARKGWPLSEIGLGRHRIDSGLFYYFPCPAGGEAEYGTDADYIDDSWVPRNFTVPLFGYAHFTHNIPPFLQEPPEWEFSYVAESDPVLRLKDCSAGGDGNV